MAEQKEAARTVMWNGWTVANKEEEGGWLNRNEEGWLISSCYTLSMKKNLCYLGCLYTCLFVTFCLEFLQRLKKAS